MALAGRLYRIGHLFFSVLLLVSGDRAEAVAKVTSLPPPPSEKINYHVVSTGETLFAIAWRYELNLQALAAINGLSPPYRIRAGQRLMLEARLAPSRQPVLPPAGRQTPPPAPRAPPTQDLATTGTPTGAAPAAATRARWRWPVAGAVTRRFDAQRLFKGIDIQGRAGQPVFAAAAGTVVYAGSGLAGYGRLIIVKHDETYLSAYAHNRSIRTTEGAQVKGGDPIAEIGGDPANPNRLYFEIRRDGKPIDPLLVLPR